MKVRVMLLPISGGVIVTRSAVAVSCGARIERQNMGILTIREHLAAMERRHTPGAEAPCLLWGG